MKEFINDLIGEEIQEYKSCTRKQKAVYIYFAASLFLLFLFACSDSIIAALSVAANLANATRLCYKHIPRFGNDE